MINDSRYCYICNKFHPATIKCPPTNVLPENGPTEIILGNGMVDVGPIAYNGKIGLLLRNRSTYIPVGQPGEINDQEYWPKTGDVVIWFDRGDRGDVLFDAVLSIRKLLMGPQGDNNV